MKLKALFQNVETMTPAAEELDALWEQVKKKG